MSLPTISVPTYELIVPSTNKAMKYRPFLVKEQKVLMIANESEDPGVMANTLKDIIKACAKTEIDVNSLAVFDVEYIFSQIRARSVGETSDLRFQCLTCKDTESIINVRIDLTKLKVEFDPNHKNPIQLEDGLMVKMRYPSAETLSKLKDSNYGVDEVFDAILECLDAVYTADNVFTASEQSLAERQTFVNDMTIEVFNTLTDFFRTMPSLTQTVEFKCPNCGAQHKQVLKGLADFF